jgi:3-vinyl bacteriochlorophyllide hydratase
MHSSAPSQAASSAARHRLYTEAERQRRDTTIWTLVQGILAPIQFCIFLVSLTLVVHYLLTANGYAAATWSVVVKTVALYLIMITGAIWEKVVFGQYLFAPAFFWEDVFSFAVISLHSLYLYGLISGAFAPTVLMYIALAAYLTYVINAGQFLWKLRRARLDYARATADLSPRISTEQVPA